jgi:hypothetical protein
MRTRSPPASRPGGAVSPRRETDARTRTSIANGLVFPFALTTEDLRMMRTLLWTVAFTLVSLTLTPGPTLAADKAKGDRVEYEVYNGYLEAADFCRANRLADKTGLALSSYSAFVDQNSFDMAFGKDDGQNVDLNKFLPNGEGPGKKKQFPKDVFDKKMVVVAAFHGSSVSAYKVEKVASDGDTLYVQYKSMSQFAGNNAVYSSPLIVAVDKGKYTSVVFIENGQKAGTADVPKEKDKDKDK